MVRIFLIILLLNSGLCSLAIAQDRRILVLYPEATAPYQEVYLQIINGLRHTTPFSLHALPIPKSHHNSANIQRWIDRYGNKNGYLVVLGQRALKVSEKLKHKLQLLTGAVDNLPNDARIPSVSLHIHPSVYLKQLKILSPRTTQLVVFYKENNKTQQIPMIEKEARQHGIVATPIAVKNVSDAVRLISQSLERVDPKKTAIWFMHHVIDLNTELLYPYILETSWHRRIPVFSGMIGHTKRGFLFSLYPDYQGIGVELGQIIIQHEQGVDIFETRLTRATQLILNTRTAQHLGLEINNKILKNVDISFPAE
jgi:putative ABC transport system substrate-binding protein